MAAILATILDLQLIKLFSKNHQNYNSGVNIERIITILSNLAAILTAILELKRIRLSTKICFGQIGFFDPQNIGVDTKITTLR